MAGCVVLSGCSFRLHAALEQNHYRLRVLTDSPSRLEVRAWERSVPAGTNGVTEFVPPSNRECIPYVLGVPLRRHVNPINTKSIVVFRDGLPERKLSLAEFLKLPVDDSGAHLLRLSPLR